MASGTDLDDDHEEHVNHEAWVIPYADMLTLLMALFLMLFAISSVDLQKFERLAAGLAQEFGGASSGVLDGGPSVLDGLGPSPVPAAAGEAGDPAVRLAAAEAALRREEALREALEAEQRRLDAVEAHVMGYVAAAGLGDAVSVRREVRGLIVTVLADEVVFEPGQARVRPEGAAVLAEVARAVAGLPNRIVVEGHTDSVPISNAQFRSNWELSTARATEVLRHLVDKLDIDPARVSAAGYGEHQPIETNETAEGRARNRRVQLAVLSEVVTNG
jgi:chemotaxis protein MotB